MLTDPVPRWSRAFRSLLAVANDFNLPIVPRLLHRARRWARYTSGSGVPQRELEEQRGVCLRIWLYVLIELARPLRHVDGG